MADFTIMDKSELKQILDASSAKLIDYIEDWKESSLLKEQLPGKWTAGQHIHHLILSTKVLRQAIYLPKFILKYKFGLNNREERNFKVLKEKYETKLAAVKIVGPAKGFNPGVKKALGKAELLEKFDFEMKLFSKRLLKWKESDLSQYILPHPLLGKLTIREMTMFTSFHTEHHLDILKDKYSKEN